MIAQDHRAHLSAQDHRVYEQRPTESDDKINGGPDGCFEKEVSSSEENEGEHEENGLAVSSATKGRAVHLRCLRSRHDKTKAVLSLQEG